MTRRDKQIAHIKEPEVYEKFAHDCLGPNETVEDYWDNYFTKWGSDRNALYFRVCWDQDIEPREEATYHDEP